MNIDYTELSLVSTDMSLVEIILELGNIDQNYFSKLLKVTPKHPLKTQKGW